MSCMWFHKIAHYPFIYIVCGHWVLEYGVHPTVAHIGGGGGGGGGGGATPGGGGGAGAGGGGAEGAAGVAGGGGTLESEK